MDIEIINFLLLLFLILLVSIKSININKGIIRKKTRIVLLDSCALIDGRIIELVKYGFVTDRLIVPDFIINELQMLADGNDNIKRERARYGLEVVQIIQKIPGVDLSITKTKMISKATDDKLVELALSMSAELYTTDFNLNQVANIKGIRVLNVNELANALRPVVIPGESISVKIIQPGSNKDQGVGYLDDGTMVVIDGTKTEIGKYVNAQITKSHQTAAGKMIFAKKLSTKKHKKT